MSGRRRAAGDETVADYDVRSPAVRTVMTVVSTVVVVAGVVALVLGASILMRDTRVATSQIDVGENNQLVIDATDADLRIVEGEPDVLTVRSSITSGLRETEYALGRRGDEIKIVSGCRTWLNPGCGVATTLEVPPGLPLVIRTTTGDVRAVKISKGVLTVRSTTGSVHATDLAVDEFSADTTTGSVTATFAQQPFAFKAITREGDITADIPDGERTYAVTTKSGSGRVESNLTPDEDGEGFVRATSVTGNIRLRSS